MFAPPARACCSASALCAALAFCASCARLVIFAAASPLDFTCRLTTTDRSLILGPLSNPGAAHAAGRALPRSSLTAASSGRGECNQPLSEQPLEKSSGGTVLFRERRGDSTGRYPQLREQLGIVA